MGDQLEQFVNKNRDQFDDATPSKDLWSRIETDIPPTQRKNGINLWKVAAVLLLCTTGYLLIERLNETEPAFDENNAYTEFIQAEAYYASIIEMKKGEMIAYGDRDLHESFLKEISVLDKSYNELKKSFEESIETEKIVDAMINNLQLRIEILNQQLMILKKLNKLENEKVSNIQI
ncbi:MAG: hypothetical protein JXQ90_14760 [Cyclobacteriaceae bacterium]